MRDGPARWRAAWLTFFACALPWKALGEPEAGAEGWVPALAAFGEAFARANRSDPIAALHLAVADAPAGPTSDPRSGVAADDPAPTLQTRDETERWVPSFGFFSGVLAQNAEGSAATSNITYRQTSYFRSFQSQTIQTEPLQAMASNDDIFVTPYVGLSTELMTPGLQDVPGRPRLFMHGDASVSFSPTRFVAMLGVPEGSVAVPPAVRRPYTDGRSFINAAGQVCAPSTSGCMRNPNAGQPVDRMGNLITNPANYVYATTDPAPVPGDAPPATSGVSIDGQGSSTTGTVKTLVVSSGFGPAFTVPVGERRLRIKPSLEYFREEMEVEGLASRAIQTNTGRTTPPCTYPTCNPNSPPPSLPTAVYAHFVTPATVLQGSETKTYYGIGPGLEVEMDAARAGPLLLAVYLSGQAYRLLGDLDIDFDATTTLTDPALNPNPGPTSPCGPTAGQCTVSAKWTFHPHAWTYRGGVGLRFRWLPED